MAETYNVYGKKTSITEPASLIASDLTEKTYTVTGLEHTTEYQFQISRVANGIESDLSDPLVITTTADIPDAPTITAEAGDASASVTVTPPTDDGGSPITEYRIYKKETSASAWETEPSATIINLDDLTVTIDGLTNGTEYSIYASAVNEVGESARDEGLVVRVTPLVPTIDVTGISLDNSTLSVEVGATGQLTATIAPENATDKTVTWSSSNEAIATVDADGTVTGVAEGTATITVIANADETKTATCEVTVTVAA